MTLEEAQQAKVDLGPGKLGLEPGMTLSTSAGGWGQHGSAGSRSRSTT